jgi:tRNA pseudouridine38-40 synthase
MPKYKMTLEYDGTNYQGWQGQENAKTLQGLLIKAAEKLLLGKADIQGAGRTDAGVHALGQVAHLTTDKNLPPKKLREGLNDLLPASINIIRVEEVHPEFHARHDAVLRTYIYVVSKRRTAFGKKYVWWVKDRLEKKLMEEALSHFVGFHDFTSFADKRLGGKVSPKVKVELAELHQEGDFLIFRLGASHFLWKMVRRMMGVIVEVGRGNLDVKDIREFLQAPSDFPARHTAPPSGLFLEQVLYRGERLKPLQLPLIL